MKKLEALLGYWQQAAIFIAAMVGVAVWDLPSLFPDYPADGWNDIAILAITALIGAFSVFLRVVHLPWWLALVLAVGLVVFGGAKLMEYRSEHSLASCEYAGRGRVTIGDNLISPRMSTRDGRVLTCTELIEDAGGNTQALWPRAEIVSNHERLGKLRSEAVVAIAAALFLLVTAMNLKPRTNGRRRSDSRVPQ